MTEPVEEERIQWQVRVLDQHGHPAYVKGGTHDGIVHIEAPSVFSMDPDETDLLDFHLKAAADRARVQLQMQRERQERRREH